VVDGPSTTLYGGRWPIDPLWPPGRGVLYYRLLVGHAPLDQNAARSLAAELTRSGGSA
jgi:hypothetical protein